jgi:membrane-bound lytic murein transglycosylase A
VFSLNSVRQAARCIIIFVFLLSGCGVKAVKTVPAPLAERKAAKLAVSEPSPSLELVSRESIPSFLDDIDQDSLNLAIERSLQYLKRLRDADVVFFGNRQSTVKEMKGTLIAFRDIMQGTEPDKVKEEKIRDVFDFYQYVGDDGKGRVIFTGYYEPILEGSFTKTERYRHPLYRAPEETVVVNPGKSNENPPSPPFPKGGEGGFSGEKKECLIGRVSKGEVVPHYRRAEIDGDGALGGRNLEILWVDDFVDLFFLHIQGSGKIRLPDGRFIQVGYAQSNGYPYRSIANYLLEKGKITKAEQSLQAIKKYLREHPEDMAAVFNYNERYIFFRVVEGGPLGALNIPITAGRTIASDLDLSPNGALALIRAKKPLIDRGVVVSWTPFSRFVLNQDAGGAIKGPGRIDLFCGSGEEAAAVAGRLKEAGELFFLIKK